MDELEKSEKNRSGQNVCTDEFEYFQKRARIEMKKDEEQKFIREMLKKM
jgi:hypothetical protein